MIVFLAVTALTAWYYLRNEADAGWLAEPCPAGSQERDVLTRYMLRHRRHRAVGVLIGLTLSVMLGTRLDGSVTLGIGPGNPSTDVLFCGIAGSVLGALSAETYRLNEPRDHLHLASLAARTPLVPINLVRLGRGLAALAVVAGALLLAGSGDAGPLAIALAGATLASVAEITRRATTSRRRPVLSENARWVDDRMRWFAHGAVANLQLAAAWLVAGWIVSKTPGTDRLWTAAAVSVTVPCCMAAAAVHLWRSGPRRPRNWNATP